MSHKFIDVIDSHTAGEPTRVIVSGGPDLGSGPLAERLARFRDAFDQYRRAAVNEPRGSDVLVGALLCAPAEPDCAAGVIFFNNVGYLNMCGHGLIGFIATLAHMGRIGAGAHRIDTPVGVVTATWHGDGAVSFANVPSHREAAAVRVEVPGIGPVLGDIAWGGNWFFLTPEREHTLELNNIDALTDYAWRVRQAVNNGGYPLVDHIEIVGQPKSPGANARNFVLCPGKAYDRSPCGTGTSAKLACLAADQKLREGDTWVQESILGTMFEGSYKRIAGSEAIIPTIKGYAFVNAESRLILSDGDPFCWGIRA